MSPFVPFTSEMFYFNLQKCVDPKSQYFEESIHFLNIPKEREELIDVHFEEAVRRMQGIISVGRTIREKR